MTLSSKSISIIKEEENVNKEQVSKSKNINKKKENKIKSDINQNNKAEDVKELEKDFEFGYAV